MNQKWEIRKQSAKPNPEDIKNLYYKTCTRYEPEVLGLI